MLLKGLVQNKNCNDEVSTLTMQLNIIRQVIQMQAENCLFMEKKKTNFHFKKQIGKLNFIIVFQFYQQFTATLQNKWIYLLYTNNVLKTKLIIK